MIDRLTKVQLSLFAVITAITLTIMAIFYLRLPATFGIGTYGVSADFVAGGGLYKNANVTYRGVEVGRVESVGLNPNGVTAEMRLNSGTPIPSNVTATVKSVSAVGEQYIDLVPPGSPSSVKLRNGFRIERQNTRIGQDVADLLKRAEALVNSLGDTRLRELLHETFIAANGSGPELARLIESARLLVDEANVNYPQVSELIDQAGPFLRPRFVPALTSSRFPMGWRGSLLRYVRQIRSFAPRWPTPRARPMKRALRSPVSAPPSRRWPPAWPTWAGSASSTTSRSSSCWWSYPRCSPRSPPPRRRPARRGCQAGLQARSERPAALRGRLPAPAVDANAGRRDAARAPEGHVLQGRPERSQHRARRP